MGASEGAPGAAAAAAKSAAGDVEQPQCVDGSHSRGTPSNHSNARTCPSRNDSIVISKLKKHLLLYVPFAGHFNPRSHPSARLEPRFYVTDTVRRAFPLVGEANYASLPCRRGLAMRVPSRA